MTRDAAEASTHASLSEPYLHQPKEAELRWMGDTSTYFLATGGKTGGAFSLVDEQAKRGEAVPRHRHAGDAESFYVLEGEITFFIGDRPSIATTNGGSASP